jgi:hypothetical protein
VADRCLDSDLAQWAVRREREAAVALLLAWGQDHEDGRAGGGLPSAVLRAAAAAIKASLHLEGVKA